MRRVLPLLALLGGAVAAVVIGLEFGGGALPPALDDPGPIVRWGLPIVAIIQHAATGLTVGGLVLACFALVPGSSSWTRTLDIAAFACGVWTIAAATAAWLRFRTIVTGDLDVDEQTVGAVTTFFFTIEAGQLLAWTVATAGLITVALIAVRGATGVAFITVATAIPLYATAGLGHASGTASHEIAVSGMWLHLVFASIWLGGLLHVAWLARSEGPPSLGDLVRRYSSLALVSFVVVAGSGIASAVIRLGDPAALATPYGVLLIAKVIGLVALGGFGIWHRRRAIPRIQSGEHPWRLIITELVVMGATVGVAAALARTATPVEEEPPAGAGVTPAEILTGEPLPPPFEFLRLFDQWKFDPLWTTVCAMMIAFYIAGVVKLARRGDAWQLGRTVSWTAGVLLLWWTTNGALNRYGEVWFSHHMLGHMLLSMAIPLLLVPGAPMTLAFRAIDKRRDGSRGGREWLWALVHSRYMNIIGNPLVAAGIFVAGLWLFYFTPIMRWATTDHLGHIWMVVHFTAAGYLFVQSLVGIDPAPKRLSYPLRLALLLGAMVFHAFFGLAIMSSEGLLLSDWYGAMGDGRDALADQKVGGGIAWSIGEIPTLVLALVLTKLWTSSDAREAKRLDRKADRDDDADLKAYNEMLQRMREQ